MLHIFFINYRKKLFLKIWGYFRHWNKNFSRFLRKLFLSFSNLFDMSQKIWLHFFFSSILYISRYVNILKIKHAGTQKNKKIQMIHLHSRRHSTQFPRPTRLPAAIRRVPASMAKEERRLLCRDFRPGSAWNSAETLIESSRRRGASATFISLLSRLMNLTFPLLVARNGFLCQVPNILSLPLPLRFSPPRRPLLRGLSCLPRAHCAGSRGNGISSLRRLLSCIWYPRETSVLGLESRTAEQKRGAQEDS